MHQCLRVPEILHLILLNIHNPKDESSHSRLGELRPGSERWRIAAINAWAQTCKTICEPALDILWYYQTGIKPLVKCLPRDVLTVDRDRIGDEQLTLRRNIDGKDLERVDLYARRIHILGDPTRAGIAPAAQGWEKIDFMICPTLLSRRTLLGFGPLLPNLDHLNIGLQDFTTLAWYPRLVIGPQLKSVKILGFWEDITFADDDEYHWENVLSILSPVLPTLKNFSNLYFDHFWHSQDGDIYMVETTERKFALKTVRATSSPHILDIMSISLNVSTLLHITSLQTLKVLGICVCHIAPNDPAIITLPELSNLVELRLLAKNPQLCSGLTQRLGPPCLKSLKIINSTKSDCGWDVDTLLLEMKPARFTPSLEHLEIIRPAYTIESDSEVQPITSATIDLLSAFKSLKSLRLHQNGDVNIGHECLQTIAQSWPKLRILDFRNRTRSNEPILTLSDLLTLASKLPDLQEIRLRFSVSEPDIFYATSTLPVSGLANRNLKVLDVCTSPISKYLGSDMATLFGAAFPNLSIFEHGWEYRSPDGDFLIIQLTQDEEDSLDTWKDAAVALGRIGVSGVDYSDR